MKTREQAEARALELWPDGKGFDIYGVPLQRTRLISRQAFLQCWEEMQLPKIPQEAEERALELFPIHEEFDVDRLKPLRDAYLQGWEEAQHDKQTCGFCVEPATELTDEKHSESLDTKEDEGSELPSEKQKEKQTCGFCVERISLDHNNIPESVYNCNIKESDFLEEQLGQRDQVNDQLREAAEQWDICEKEAKLRFSKIKKNQLWKRRIWEVGAKFAVAICNGYENEVPFNKVLNKGKNSKKH